MAVNNDASRTEAIGAWRAQLGGGRVRDDAATLARYGHNVTEYRPRDVWAIVYPRSAADVSAVVSTAARCGVALYPLSTGRNWGVGSKLPIADGAAIVDLSGMDAIRSVDERGRTAVVEPGVTQAALATHLADRGASLRLNVTGSGGDTSVVGNALERGVGVLGQRSDDVRGLEVVLGTGDVVHTGLWHCAPDGGARVHHYAPGLGPDLTGVFLQSGMGIVTAMAVRLFPRQPASLVLAVCTEAALPGVVDIVGALRAEGVLRDRVEIDRADDPRVAALAQDLAPDGPRPWVMWFALHGSARMRDAAFAEVAERLAPSCARFDRLDAPADAAAHGLDPETVQVRFDLVAGRPSDFSIRAMARAHGVDARAAGQGLDLDEVREIPGFVCALPAVPLDGAAVADVARCADETARACGVAVYLSFNTIGDGAMEGYLRASFDRRDPDAVARCHRWCERVHAALGARGVFPLRVDVERMAAAIAAGGEPFWRAVGLVDRALDPSGVIAPGRYAPRR